MIRMRKAFSIVELMIVVAILGILAAIVVPQFNSQSRTARNATARTNLQSLRGAIRLYATRNGGVPPGYPGNDTSAIPTFATIEAQLTGFGGYLTEMPENPFNKKTACKVLGNLDAFPAAPGQTDQYGWIYQPATETIRLNWPGTDTEGVDYYAY